MNSSNWLAYYEGNKRNRPEPKWNLSSPLDRDAQGVLARSLSHFQLGETGEGKFLLAGAREQAPDDVTYHQALELFVREENEHARLLEKIVTRFGGAKIERHWTHGLFRLLRHALRFKFEVQLLVIAELAGAAYYRLLQARTRDSVLEEMCQLLLKDEAQHIAFHADWLGDFLSRLLPLERAAWEIQFQILFTAAACVAWIDHRPALRISGSNRVEFFSHARRECIHFLRQLQITASGSIPVAAWPSKVT